MISLVLIVLLVSLASIDCQAQQQWTLRQCMDYAIEHNIVSSNRTTCVVNKSFLSQPLETAVCLI